MRKPQLFAEFRLDEAGAPRYLTYEGLKHFEIILSIQDPPQDTYAVTYVLHETYHDPRRESRDSDTRFSDEITAFGDYTVRAKLRRKQKVDLVATDLSKALERRYLERGGGSQVIAEAIT